MHTAVGVDPKDFDKDRTAKAKRGEWWWYDPSAAWPKKAPFERPEDWRDDLPDLPGLRGL